MPRRACFNFVPKNLKERYGKVCYKQRPWRDNIGAKWNACEFDCRGVHEVIEITSCRRQQLRTSQFWGFMRCMRDDMPTDFVQFISKLGSGLLFLFSLLRRVESMRSLLVSFCPWSDIVDDNVQQFARGRRCQRCDRYNGIWPGRWRPRCLGQENHPDEYMEGLYRSCPDMDWQIRQPLDSTRMQQPG